MQGCCTIKGTAMLCAVGWHSMNERRWARPVMIGLPHPSPEVFPQLAWTSYLVMVGELSSQCQFGG
jgi:hypothetical protein